jgi:glycerate kinase
MARPLRVVVAPDSFKGSLGAPEAAAAIAAGIIRGAPGATAIQCPMADGGEGTLDAVLRASGSAASRGEIKVEGAGGAPIRAGYGIVDRDGTRTAILECAQVVAITDAAGMAVPVTSRTTTGLGLQLRALLDLDVRRFMVGLGGSSTNDGGAGLLVALGLRLLDAGGRDVEPTPDGLTRLARADASALDARLAACEITIMSDVDNPLAGERGATAIFGPQKGVEAGQVAAIDATLARYAAIVESAIGRRASERPGAGAAGGLGHALMLAGGTMRSGAQVVADLIGLDAALAGADWAITGEGRSDAQTLLSKGPCVVADHARARGVPVMLLSGALDAASLPALHARFDGGCFALPAGPATLDACVRDAAALLADRAEAVARLFSAARRNSSG